MSQPTQPGSNIGLSLVVNYLIALYNWSRDPSNRNISITSKYVNQGVALIEVLRCLGVLITTFEYNEFVILRQWFLGGLEDREEATQAEIDRAYDVLADICNREFPDRSSESLEGIVWMRTNNGWRNNNGKDTTGK